MFRIINDVLGKLNATMPPRVNTTLPKPGMAFLIGKDLKMRINY